MNKAKHILIVTDAFVPPMQGIRMRNLAQNLQRFGYQCRLVCEVVDSSILPTDIPTTPFRFLFSGTAWYTRWINALLRLLDKLFLLKEKRLERMLLKTIDFQAIDAIIVSAYLFPFRSVRRVAERYHIPFIVDLRDIVEQWDSLKYLNFPHNNPLARHIAARYLRLSTTERNNTLSTAQAVVSISEWHVNTLRAFHPNVHLIYNGFDEQQFAFKPLRTDRFYITYTGKIYNLTLRNPELLFAALHNLVQKQILPLDELELRFYIEPEATEIIQQLAARYEMAQAVRCLPFVANEDINNVLAQSSIVLILNNPNTQESPIHGVLPTKFYEAVGVEKPVLCLPADHDCLQQMVEQTHAGLSSDDPQEIQTFILDKYAEWKQNGFTRQGINPAMRQRFSRQYQARQFEQLLQSPITNHQTQITNNQSPITLVDICWTLFYSNTTYDFLQTKGNWWNSLIYKLFRYDVVRSRALKRFNRLSREEQLARAEQFYTTYLLPRKIDEVWQLIEGKDIILVSQTMDVIAETIAKHIGAKAYYATQTKEEVLAYYTDFDIITDNINDLELIKHARQATIITYNNLSRWKKVLPRDLNVHFIETGRNKY